MKKKEKRLIAILLIILAIVLIIFFVRQNKNEGENGTGVTDSQQIAKSEGTYTETLDDGTVLNTSEEFNKTKTYNGLEISNIQYTEKNGMTVLLADVKNTSNTAHSLELVKIIVEGKNGEDMAVMNSIIGDVGPGETIELNASMTGNIVNARDFRIEKSE